MKKINNNTVICVKGFKWGNLFRLDRITDIVCQTTTLSRYVHSFVIIKKCGKHFKLESNPNGIYITKVSEKRILKLINSNRADCFYRRPKSMFAKEVMGLVNMLIDIEENVLHIGKYSFKGLFNQLPLNLLRLSFIKQTNPFKMFCSETVNYYMTGSLKSYKVAPVDIALNDDKYKRIK